MARVVIVGASVAGVRTAQALRMQGFAGAITLIGEEPHHPYDKPPLSKEHLRPDAPHDPPALVSAEELEQLAVDLHLGVRATGLDPAARVLHTDAGEHTYDQLVIATGVVPRTLPGSGLAGVRTVRTADDAAFLRSQLTTTPRVTVIGAGFIGAEFASAARARGCQVTVVEAQQTPMAHLFGERVGARLAALHEANGVALRTGARFERFVGDGHVEGVVLADGEVVPADLVVVGIGATPATDWLRGSGLPVDDGVACESDLSVVGHPEIFAAGDVARWPHPHYGEPIRIEHWTNANEHGAIVASAIAGGPAPRAQVPYVWSDQYGHRIQIVGLPSRGTPAYVTGDGPTDLVAVYADRAGSTVGAVVVDDSRTFMKLRKAVTKRTAFADLDLPQTSPAPA
ncbi:NAD(P)/FAD-dependent oxidoreductase [Nocardioides massiliensis]|uniref:NADPH-dependent 2,4-dienoyl-CoA reductase/sulfur reductase-like enzyme n=1 Tax=Nocardioides massiliensis TaxID=1325935 RepID=A0ABT9NTH3_9ACTN|nr:FAD-dependent oxidoreductase [Nocardioides massiliensis]MDP9823722.1 NADPH-dependent 2,4-dienoyl-CoA reductase/sulfur reductase-like enzyme [Nocardioides massiliensis]